MRRFERKEGDSRREELRRKWGFEDPVANESLERTHQYILHRIRPLMGTMKDGPKKRHYEDKIRFEQLWQDVTISHWKDYYGEKKAVHT